MDGGVRERTGPSACSAMSAERDDTAMRGWHGAIWDVASPIETSELCHLTSRGRH
jgi:hypothetical protein